MKKGWMRNHPADELNPNESLGQVTTVTQLITDALQGAQMRARHFP